MKPRAFIASSGETLDVAYALQENLEREAEITVWSQAIFEPSKTALDSLISSLEEFDFGIFVFGPDDEVKLRGEQYQIARDNVVFELGLFVGKLGKDRNFLVMPRGQESFHLPTDLLGVTPVSFDPDRQDGNISAALGPACSKITKAIRKYGVLQRAGRTGTAGDVRPSVRTPDSPFLNQLINSAIETVCRAVSLPQSPEAVKIRVFIFVKRGPQLVCSHYWAPNPIKEMVGRLKFDITPEVGKKVAVVRAVINEEITRTKVAPLPDSLEQSSGGVAEDVSFVLAAPIYKDDGSIWGCVDFDASTAQAETFLSTEVSDATMFQLAQHLKIIFSLHG